MISGGLLAVLFSKIDLDAMLGILLDFSPSAVAVGIVLFWFSIVFATQRYRLVLEDYGGVKPDWWPLIGINIFSLFVTHCVPVSAAA